jgi:phosphopantetheinyl transferase (holo-ACP synthase)
MQQITIRGITPEIEREIRRMAKDNRKSINQVIKEIIHKEFKRPEAPASSLKQLAGGWSRKEAADFEHSIKSCEQIDEDMWKN